MLFFLNFIFSWKKLKNFYTCYLFLQKKIVQYHKLIRLQPVPSINTTNLNNNTCITKNNSKNLLPDTIPGVFDTAGSYDADENKNNNTKKNANVLLQSSISSKASSKA